MVRLPACACIVPELVKEMVEIPRLPIWDTIVLWLIMLCAWRLTLFMAVITGAAADVPDGSAFVIVPLASRLRFPELVIAPELTMLSPALRLRFPELVTAPELSMLPPALRLILLSEDTVTPESTVMFCTESAAFPAFTVPEPPVFKLSMVDPLLLWLISRDWTLPVGFMLMSAPAVASVANEPVGATIVSGPDETPEFTVRPLVPFTIAPAPRIRTGPPSVIVLARLVLPANMFISDPLAILILFPAVMLPTFIIPACGLPTEKEPVVILPFTIVTAPSDKFAVAEVISILPVLLMAPEAVSEPALTAFPLAAPAMMVMFPFVPAPSPPDCTLRLAGSVTVPESALEPAKAII